MTDNLEQRARDLLNAVTAGRDPFPFVMWDETCHRETSISLEAVCRAIEAHDQTQADFDDFRCEVSEAMIDDIRALPS